MPTIQEIEERTRGRGKDGALVEFYEDWWTLARTGYGEARGEPFIGKVAMMYVVTNRVLAGKWRNTIREVCLQPKQFSCWNASDPNRAKLTTVSLPDKRFLECLGVAALVMSKAVPDPTHGATHYYNPAVVSPRWAKSMIETAVIGRHRFLRERA